MGDQLTFLADPALPDFSLELRCGGIVAGIDEAGRGPLAGPVVAAAVILNPANTPAGLNDSKKLSAEKRSRLFTAISACAEFAVGVAEVDEIDELNILQATFLAMRRAVAALSRPPDHCLVDGNLDPGLGISTRCVVKGDQLSLSIAAASIVAKVTRDKIMMELAKEYPEYGWERNAGYGVPAHLKALHMVGASPYHRKSFAPVRNLSR